MDLERNGKGINDKVRNCENGLKIEWKQQPRSNLTTTICLIAEV